MRVVAGAKRFTAHAGRHERWVFTDLHLNVRQGEILVLMGPSGSGKSTLLRIIAGLDELTSGQLHRSERAGLMFQDPLLLPWRNVAANIGLGLSFRANADVAENADVDAAATDLGIAHLLDARVDAISGGEAQRVALARAVVTRPELLLLDEPFAALDPPTRRSLQDWFVRLVRERNLTAVFVTHDLDEALRVGDRVALLGPGAENLTGVWEIASGEEAATLAVREEIARSFTHPATKQLLAAGPEGLPHTDAPHQDAGAAGSVGGGLSRRRLLQIGAGAGIVAAASPFALRALSTRSPRSSAAGSAPPLRIGYLPITDAAPLLVASALGYYRDEQVAVDTPLRFRSWDAITEAFESGHLDAAHLLMPTVVELRFLRHLPVKIVAWNHMNGSALTVANHVNSIRDLDGTTVAIPFWYSIHNVTLQLLLEDAGLVVVPRGKPGRGQVALSVMAPSDMVPALAGGNIGGYIVAEPFNAMAELKGVGKIARFTGDVWRNHACCVVVMHERFIDSHPEAATRFLRSLARAQLVCQHDHHRAVDTLTTGARPFLPEPVPSVTRTFDDYDLATYGPSGAIRHPQWNVDRIDFQPFPFASYTEEVVRRLQTTVLTPAPTFLAGLDPAAAHAELVDDRFARSAVHALGGPARFGLPSNLKRTEDIEV